MQKNSREIPVLFKFKEQCCGCEACVAICPRNAINMKEDEEGFKYPCIDGERCVGCGLCVKICTFK